MPNSYVESEKSDEPSQKAIKKNGSKTSDSNKKLSDITMEAEALLSTPRDIPKGPPPQEAWLEVRFPSFFSNFPARARAFWYNFVTKMCRYMRDSNGLIIINFDSKRFLIDNI